MSEIRYSELSAFLEKESARDRPSWPPIFLLYGEEVLYKKGLDHLITIILGSLSRDVNCETLDGLNENVPAALERMRTFSLLSDRKIVIMADARIFQSRQNLDKLWEQAIKAGQAGNMKKASRCLLDLMSVQNLSFDDFDGASPETVLNPPENGDHLKWVPAVLDHCHQKGLQVPKEANPQHLLEKAIEDGFPTGHHLVITTELVDKRRRLYKAIREVGIIVDCSVPKGSRKADRAAQEAVLDAAVAEVLQDAGKRMDPPARRALYDMTGFDLRTVTANMEKLVHYTGERDTIGTADVQAALERTRRDPLYELTEAVSNRNLAGALFYLQSLLAGGEFDHPLPLLAAVTNQMRRLLVAKDFAQSAYGRAWHPGCSYPQFQSQVMPAIKAFDEALQKRLDRWGQTLAEAPPADGEKLTPKRKAMLRSDLFMAGKGRSPYPMYKTLQKTERYTRAELLHALRELSGADRRMKRSGQSGRLILEHVLFSICQTRTSENATGEKDVQAKYERQR